MKIKEVPFSWIPRWGYRLDVEPFVGGAVEARVYLEKASYPKQALHELTTGHSGGIYNGPMFRRNYVDSREHGVPFLTSGSMLRADLTHVGLLRRKDAESTKLGYLRLTRGTTLISCSGSIGRTVYARPDMEGMWASQDIMKVVPDPRKISSGYVFAFLSSKFGVPMVTSGTYGAIIQHIEPEHIADLPVPRLGEELENRVHQLVEEAAQARSTAVRLLAEVKLQLTDQLGLGVWSNSERGTASSAKSGWLADRLDAYYYSARCIFARQAFDAAPNFELRRLQSVADVFIPGIFKRLYADDPSFGVPYITGADVFQIAPTSDQYLQRRVAETYGLVIGKGTILVQEAGQLGGLIGRSVLVGNYLDGFAVSNNMIRITAKDPADTGYLFAVLSSEPGVTLIAREAAGSSIPHIDANRVRQIEIPWASQAIRAAIGAPVVQAWSLRDKACADELEARELVERAIKEAA